MRSQEWAFLGLGLQTALGKKLSPQFCFHFVLLLLSLAIYDPPVYVENQFPECSELQVAEDWPCVH